VTDGYRLLVFFIRAAALVMLGLNLYYRQAPPHGGPGWV
jgi:hypothetical protein